MEESTGPAWTCDALSYPYYRSVCQAVSGLQLFLGLWRKSDSRSDPVFLVLGRIFRVSWLEALLIGACLAYVR
jgi:hypothetical protein